MKMKYIAPSTTLITLHSEGTLMNTSPYNSIGFGSPVNSYSSPFRKRLLEEEWDEDFE